MAFTKKDLRNLDLIETKDGLLYVATQGEEEMGFLEVGRYYFNGFLEEEEIAKVYRPTITQGYNNSWALFKGEFERAKEEYELVYEYQEPVKEITMEELEKQYGCKVKIVKGDK